MEKHDDLLKQVIEMITKRPFEIDDAKRCTVIYHPDLEHPDYYFAFDGITVGTVRFRSLMAAGWTCTFEPLEKYK